MKALFYKDWITVRASVMIYSVIFAGLGFMNYLNFRFERSVFDSLPWFAVLYTVFGHLALSVEAPSNLDYHVHAMPFTRRQVVWSKFIPAIVMTVLAIPFSAGYGSFFFRDRHYLVSVSLLSVFFIGIFLALYFIVHYHLSGKRRMFLSFGLYGVLIVTIKIFDPSLKLSVPHNIVEGMVAQPILGGIGVLAVIVVAFAISIRLCIRRFERKDIY